MITAQNEITPKIDLLVASSKKLLPDLLGEVDFDSDTWSIKALHNSTTGANTPNIHFKELSGGKGREIGVESLKTIPEPFTDVIKAWLVLQRPSASLMKSGAYAARVLWSVWQGEFRSFEDWATLSSRVLSRAEESMKARELSEGQVHQTSWVLHALKEWLVAQSICATIEWIPETPNTIAIKNQTLEGRKYRAERLPSMRALEALADIYSNQELGYEDRVLICFVSLQLVGGFRYNEVATMPDKCEHWEARNGERQLALKFWNQKSKGSDWQFAKRWISPLATPLVLDLLKEIRSLTKSARRTAKALEENPDTVHIPWADDDEMTEAEVCKALCCLPQLLKFRPQESRQVAGKPLEPCRIEEGRRNEYFYKIGAILSYLESKKIDGELDWLLGNPEDEIAEDKVMELFPCTNSTTYIRSKKGPFGGYSRAIKQPRTERGRKHCFYRTKDIQEILLARRHPLWTLKLNTGKVQALSDTLFVLPENWTGFRNASPNHLLAESIIHAQVNGFLGSTGAKKSIFERLGYREGGEGGAFCSITSHQLRHFVNTAARNGGMSRMQISLWMQRKDSASTTLYDHMTPEESARLGRERMKEGLILGPMVSIAKELESEGELFLDDVKAMHKTAIGWCTQNFSQEPCAYDKACLRNCKHYHITPGDKSEIQNLVQIGKHSTLQLKAIEKREEQGARVADAQKSHNLLQLEGVKKALALHNQQASTGVFPDGEDMSKTIDQEFLYGW